MEDFIKSIRDHVQDSLLGYLADLNGGTRSDSRPGMVLDDWAEDERAEFRQEYEDGGCTCFISPPCGYCTHHGNPLNQEETDDCWIPVLKGGVK